MDPVTQPLRIARLDQRSAADFADDLLSMNASSDWDDWGREELLAERPEKWNPLPTRAPWNPGRGLSGGIAHARQRACASCGR